MEVSSVNNGGINRRIRPIGWMVILFLTFSPLLTGAQDTLPALNTTDPYFFSGDTAVDAGRDSLIRDMAARMESAVHDDKTPFKPNPKKAWKVAAIFPGVGQVYNRQYWKLPIVYGGMTGCAYAISWNNRTYQDYKNAYFSILADSKADPASEHPENWSDNWIVFVPGSADPASRLHNTSFHSQLKRGKDYFRRYRDLSIIITIGIYLIVVADAYVDAQMFDFDVSPDLSFQVTPVFLPETFYHARSYGINICMNF